MILVSFSMKICAIATTGTHKRNKPWKTLVQSSLASTMCFLLHNFTTISHFYRSNNNPPTILILQVNVQLNFSSISSPLFYSSISPPICPSLHTPFSLSFFISLWSLLFSFIISTLCSFALFSLFFPWFRSRSFLLLISLDVTFSISFCLHSIFTGFPSLLLNY